MPLNDPPKMNRRRPGSGRPQRPVLLPGRKTSPARPNLIVSSQSGDRQYRLRKPLQAGGIYRVKQKPPYWRSLSPRLAGGGRVPEGRVNDWLLVLAAKKIPYSFSPAGDRPRLYVPPLYEGVALYEIRAFEQEKTMPVFLPPKRDNLAGVLFFLLLLTLWHGLRWNWFGVSLPSPPFPPDPGAWPAAYRLDVYRVTVMHEWWRTVTALTLHADEVHLCSNVGFGLIFLAAVCRRAGLGLGIGLAVLAGATGNACNALTRDAGFLSIGFSTALFGALGSLCALGGSDVLRHMRRWRRTHRSTASASGLWWHVTIPLAAGAALLGLLGGGGEVRTDYPAHIWGFVCGVLLSMLFLPLETRLSALKATTQKLVQTGIFAATLSGVAGIWVWVLRPSTV